MLQKERDSLYGLMEVRSILDCAFLRIYLPDTLCLGPGCSSFDGALLEIGPVLVNGTGSNARLVKNPGRWNEYANILFIDQPAGTGYSYLNRGRAVSELAPAADQLVNFLGNFYTVFPEYGKMDVSQITIQTFQNPVLILPPTDVSRRRVLRRHDSPIPCESNAVSNISALVKSFTGHAAWQRMVRPRIAISSICRLCQSQRRGSQDCEDKQRIPEPDSCGQGVQ